MELGGPHFSMTAEEAGALAESLQARHVVPVHVEGWAHFSEGREAATAALAGSPVAERVTRLRPGAPHEFAR